MRKLYCTIIILLLGSMYLVSGQKLDRFPSYFFLGVSNEEFFTQSDYIFEGKLISQRPYPNEDTSKIWSSILVEVIYVLKGSDEIQKGQIEIIKNSGNVGAGYDEYGNEIIIEYQSEFDFQPFRHGIFFCKKTDLSIRPAPNNPSIEIFNNVRKAGLSYDFKTHGYNFQLFGLDNLYFKNMEEFYDYAKQYEGITVPEQQKKNLNTQRSGTSYYNPKLEQFMEQQWDLYNSVMQNKSNMISPRGLRELTVSIKNQEVTGDSVRFFEFDVCGATNLPRTDLANMIARLDFNTDIFGTFLDSNGAISLSLGALFDSSTYRAIVYDVDSGRINIGLTTHPPFLPLPTYNWTLLDTMPMLLFHVKIAILPDAPTGNADIVFQEQDFTSIFSTCFFINIFLDYNITYYIEPTPFTITTDNVEITSFYPSHIIAGAGDTLTITGKNFGNTQGDIYFPNANDGGEASAKIFHSDYIKVWSDTMIKVIIPSYDFDTVNKIRSSAGSGKFDITTTSGKTASSDTSLIVDYCLINVGYPDSIDDKRLYLVNKNNINGIIFTLDTSFQNNIPAIQCIEKALCAWSGNLGIVLALEKDQNGNIVFVDSMTSSNKNRIWIENNRSSGMAVPTRYASCRSPITTHFRWERCDIQIAPQALKTSNGIIYPWDYRTSGIVPAGYGCFYNAFLHELGHVLGLGHVSDSNDIMYYSENISYSQPVWDLLTVGGMHFQAMERIYNESRNRTIGCTGIQPINKEVPTIDYFAINNGDTVTESSFVVLNNHCSVCPTHYVADDNPNFSNTQWADYSTEPSYPLSGISQTNIVYLKVKNAIGESTVAVDSIYRQQLSIENILPDTQGIIYVNKNVTSGDESGNSWNNATKELANALLAAKINSSIKKIYVAEGTYNPMYPADDISIDPRDRAFVLVDNVALYGGFPANSDNNTTISDRDWETYPTILSGYLDSINVYHVAIAAGNTTTTMKSIDGFIIEAGMASGTGSITTGSITVNEISIERSNGGGIYIKSSNIGVPVFLSNLKIQNCHATYGGGIYNKSTRVSMDSLWIMNNTANSAGGGIYNEYTTIFMNHLWITNNTANAGGGIFNKQIRGTVRNLWIMNNTANSVGGGMLTNYILSPIIFRDISIIGNHANSGGGGMYNSIINRAGVGMSNSNISVVCLNFYICGNKTNGIGSAIFNHGSSPEYYNALIAQNETQGNIATNATGSIVNKNGSSPEFHNATIAMCIPDGIGMVNDQSSSPYLCNSIIWSGSLFQGGGGQYPVLDLVNSATTYHRCLIQNMYPVGSNLTGIVNPRFINPVSISNYHDNYGDYHLMSNGPHNSGDNTCINPYSSYGDLDNSPRILGNIGLGCYEFDPENPNPENNPYHKNMGSKDILPGQENSISVLNMQLIVYPNPISSGQRPMLFLGEDNLYYEHPVDVKVYSLEGKQIHSKTYSNGNITLDIPQLPAGMYVVNVRTQEGIVYNKKLVITQ